MYTTRGLGTTQDGFYTAMDQAQAGMERLNALVEKAPAAKRADWNRLLKMIQERLTNLERRAEFASANVNLSIIDSLRNEVNIILARDILQREMRWRKELGLKPIAYRSYGRSGIVSMVAHSDKWRKGYMAGLGDPGFWDSLKEFFTESVEAGKAAMASQAEKTYRIFQSTVSRVKAAKARHVEQQRRVQELQARGDDRAPDLLRGVGERVTKTANAETILRRVANDVYTMGGAARATEYIRTELGEFTERESAAILFYDSDVQQAARLMDEVEEGDRAFDRVSPLVPVVAGGAGLLAAGALGYLLLRGRKRR